MLNGPEGNPLQSQRYSPRDDHFNAVAEELALFGDRDLAVAGYLHGVTDRISPFLNKGIISSDTATILQERQRLRSLTESQDSDLGTRLHRDVLPAFEDLRSAILLVFEQLLHADSTSSGRAFTLSFRHSPATVIPALFSTPSDHASEREQAHFLRVVCAGIAEYLGMWTLRNAAEDIALIIEDRHQVTKVLEIVHSSAALHGLTELISLVRGAATDNNVDSAPLQFRWEWHHAARISHLVNSRDTTKFDNLDPFGMVTVVCTDARACYLMLHQLHNSPNCTPLISGLKDHFARRFGTYQALHTDLVFDNRSRVRVRIVPANGDDSRFDIYDRERFLSLRRRSVPRENGARIVVFSPMGKAVSLASGSTVLNLAAAIHTDLLPRAESATINNIGGKSVFHPLRNGDVVQVNDTPQPRLLPADWTKHVPEKLRPEIRDAFREGYNSALEFAARNLIRNRIAAEAAEALDVGLDDGVIDAVVERAGELLASKYVDIHWPAARGARYWLRQIALCDIQDPGGILKPSTYFPALREHLIVLTIDEIRHSPASLIDHVSVPEEFIDAFDSLTSCRWCKPTGGQKVQGVIQNRNLVLHRHGAACATGGKPIKWKSIHRYGAYYVVHARDRVGLAADVLRAVSDRAIDLIEHIGSPLGDTDVVRLYVRDLSDSQRKSLHAALRLVAGVIRVIGPDEAPIPFLEGTLPPRRTLPPTAYRSYTPWSTGAHIVQPYQFYGRRQEFEDLLNSLERASSSKGTASAVIISGPLRYGKSSLLHKLIHDAEARDTGTVGISSEYVRADNSDYYARLTERALRKLGDPSDPAPGRTPLGDAIKKLSRKFERVIVGIDEVVGLLVAESTKGGLAATLEFFDFLRTIPGVMLVLSIFERGLNRLDLDLSVFSKYERIRLESLTLPDAASLIYAAQHRPELGIAANGDVVRQIHTLTRGNPYWLSLIADELYKHYKVGSAYTQEDVEFALQQLLDDPRWIQDKSADLNAFERDILKLLIKVSSIKFEELFSELQNTHKDLSSEVLDGALVLLEAGGVVYRPARKEFSIAAPILATYLKHKWSS